MKTCSWPDCQNAGQHPQRNAKGKTIGDWCDDHKLEIEAVVALYGNFYIYIDAKTKKLAPIHPRDVENIITVGKAKVFLVRTSKGLAAVGGNHIIEL